jgi:hypothetical protein
MYLVVAVPVRNVPPKLGEAVDLTCRSQDVGQNVPGSEAVATGPSRSCAAWARPSGARLGSE